MAGLHWTSAEWLRTLPDDQTTLDRAPTQEERDQIQQGDLDNFLLAIIGRVDPEDSEGTGTQLQYSIVFDDGLNPDVLRGAYCPATGSPAGGTCTIPIGTLVVDMRSVPFDSTGTLTVELVDLDDDSIVPFGRDSRPTGTVTARTVVDTDFQRVQYTITTTGVDFSANPDLDGDGIRWIKWMR